MILLVFSKQENSLCICQVCQSLLVTEEDNLWLKYLDLLWKFKVWHMTRVLYSSVLKSCVRNSWSVWHESRRMRDTSPKTLFSRLVYTSVLVWFLAFRGLVSRAISWLAGLDAVRRRKCKLINWSFCFMQHCFLTRKGLTHFTRKI